MRLTKVVQNMRTLLIQEMMVLVVLTVRGQEYRMRFIPL